MDLPKRKPIRLKNYDYAQNNAYFITICTYNRAELFGEIVGATLRGRPNFPDVSNTGDHTGSPLLLCNNKNFTLISTYAILRAKGGEAYEE